MASTSVERKLVLRLASLLWRLRRARQWKRACSISRLTICVSSGRAAKVNRSLEKLSMRCSGGLTRSVSIRHRTPSPTKRRPYRVQGLFLSNLPSIAPLTSRVAFCVSPICPTSRSIASAASSGRGRVRVRRRRGTTAERSADRPAHRGLPQTPHQEQTSRPSKRCYSIKVVRKNNDLLLLVEVPIFHNVLASP